MDDQEKEQEKKKIGHWIQTVLEEGKGLTKWESDFVSSLEEQFQKRGTLSEKQVAILERIYADKTP